MPNVVYGLALIVYGIGAYAESSTSATVLSTRFHKKRIRKERLNSDLSNEAHEKDQDDYPTFVKPTRVQPVPIESAPRSPNAREKDATIRRSTSFNSSEISFFIRPWDTRKNYFQGWKDIVEALSNHPDRKFEEHAARFSLCFRANGKIDFINRLPLRTALRPYLVFGYDRVGEEEARLLASRNDILQVGYDLRPLFNNSGKRMRGVTVAPPRYFKASPFDPAQNPRFFLTFRGLPTVGIKGTSTVRLDLKNSFHRQMAPSNVIVDMVRDSDYFSPTWGDLSYESLFNASYALVPRGQARWTYRFSEAIGACSIPVVMADGITLPYEELIDWKTAAVRLPESLAQAGPETMLRHLSDDQGVIQKMRKRVCQINSQYFKTASLRANAMLRSAAIRSTFHTRDVA